jgi:(p)ppGpp synthase/HD superfamily hydrolase
MISKEVIAKEKLKIRQILSEDQINQREHLVSNIKNTEKPKHENVKQDAIIIGDDNIQMDYTMAKCCSPLPAMK